MPSFSGQPFDHLRLVCRKRGSARFPPAVVPEDTTTAANKANRGTHATTLRGRSTAATTNWVSRQDSRKQAGLPTIEAGIPLLLKIDTSLDLDDLRRQFGLEIISEQEDGFVLVSSQDVSLANFDQKLTNYVAGITGSGNISKIHEIREDLTNEERLRQVLSDGVLSDWHSLDDNATYIYDISIACEGDWELPRAFTPRGNWGDAANTRHAETRQQEINAAYERWDDLQYQRSEKAKEIIRFYNGDVIGEFHGNLSGNQTIPDYFTLRVRMIGRGVRDLVVNFPYVFEVAEPDDIETPQQIARQYAELQSTLTIEPAHDDAATVCVIDSGIQEEHLYLSPGIDTGSSHCFLPGVASTDVADYVASGGHGTRVAGAVLYGDNIPTDGTFQLNTWVQNARVLDAQCDLPSSLLPAAMIRDVVSHFHDGPKQTRLFNQSINARMPCRHLHMSAWASEIDLLSFDNDILVIQSVGNLRPTDAAPILGVSQHLVAGRDYPDYLDEPACGVANPAQSFQALAVGSVAYGAFEQDGWRTFASESGHPSAFSRAGFGVWDSIKPEVVEYAGDYLRSGTANPVVSYPDVGQTQYPPLVRSTLGGGPAVARDMVGTSFAAPKVSRIAAALQNAMPDDSCLLYRALIVQSAQWPPWAETLPADQQAKVLRRIGYGIPDAERASTNSDYRVTLVTSEDQEIAAGDCHVFQVPVPPQLRNPADDHRIRIDVTLSYVSKPRRTRRTERGYLATWLEWVSSGNGEHVDDFIDRVVVTDSAAPRSPGGFGWTIESRTTWGTLRGIRRNIGTVQKDWAYLNSNSLPEDFCIAVRGHAGWSKAAESRGRYALTVTFQSVGQELALYEPIEVAVEELRLQVEAELEVEAEAQIEVGEANEGDE